MAANIPTTRSECEARDSADPLAAARTAFALPEGVIYLDGHSLGPATHAALKRVQTTAQEEWARGLIRSWNDAGWFELPRTVGAKLARLIGAQADEVIVTDSVSVNLFKLATAALPLARGRVIIVEDSEFPTDQYVAEGIAGVTGAELMRVGVGKGTDALARTGGVLIKSVVNYRTSLVEDVAASEEIATQAGGVIVWDLSHATGVLDLQLNAHGAKLATGCTYKFINGGPGAPSFIYARGDVAARMQSPVSGWFGHAAPFAFDAGYHPLEGVGRFAAGTPGVLSLSALDASLSAFDGVAMSDVAAKARALGDLVATRTAELGLESISPANSLARGGHVSVRHADGYAVTQALIARGVIPDFRAPDAIRFGVAPLYVRFVDVWDAMDQLADILATRAWDRPEFLRRAAVT
ncbi:MAG: aminotransferase class V-fold PLP-dependent enzyme [Burkholderiales bacterium]|nr:MAG: aminotransferase class V-fold PLP-dependent enzyme [Burkholderiales bacterium]